MKTSGVMKSLGIFPLIVVLMLSGCGGEGSGKLSDGVCKDIKALIVEYLRQLEKSNHEDDTLLKVGMAYEQFKRGGCAEKITFPFERELNELSIKEQEELGHRLHQR